MPAPSEFQPQKIRNRVLEKNNKKNVLVNKKNIIMEMPARDITSSDSTCSSECSSRDGSAVKVAPTIKRRVRPSSRFESGKVVHEKNSLGISSGLVSGSVKRCDWITPHSDQLYTSFHDEEWGVPVHDDKKLFELLVLSIALAEFTWPTILNKRHVFRKVFYNFELARIAKFSEKDMYVFVSNGRTLLSEPKLRAVVENAKQMLKIQQEFGSFNNYLWSFVNHKTIRNGFQYGRQIPVKTPKAELISKDFMKRGFRCVGPSVVYSFMQVTGLVNDHLLTCFRYQECDNNINNDLIQKNDNVEGTN